MAILLQKPNRVVENRFARLCVRIHLDPALYSKQARDLTQFDRLLKFLDQLAA
jgi:hypothetical protein